MVQYEKEYFQAIRDIVIIWMPMKFISKTKYNKKHITEYYMREILFVLFNIFWE